MLLKLFTKSDEVSLQLGKVLHDRHNLVLQRIKLVEEGAVSKGRESEISDGHLVSRYELLRGVSFQTLLNCGQPFR